MRKFLLILALAFTFICIMPNESNAQTMWFKTYQMAIKFKINGYWGNWSKWEKCTMPIKFDLDNDIIIIYSNKTQYYKVVEQGESPYDSSGRQILFYVVDGEGDRGYIRLRVENTGGCQIYVDFADVSWVYNIYRTE